MAEFNGVIVMDKPQGFTSFDVVAKMRGICQMKKIGHGGTLDPMATGVLPVFLGNATKAMDLQPNQDKTYEGLILFGRQTNTGDITGEVLKTDARQILQQDFRAVLPFFLGVQQQLPPMYSAVKVGGKALYKYAREGKTVALKPRSITVKDIGFLGEEGSGCFRFYTACSKGTYIRVLVEDIAKKLGTVATLAGLRRTKAGVYTLSQALTFEELQRAKQEGTLHSLVRPVQQLFVQYPKLKIGEKDKQRLLNGALVYAGEAPGLYSVFFNEEFLGVARSEQAGEIRALKMFCERE